MARFIEISGKPQHAEAFAAAVEKWINAEPLAMKCGFRMPGRLYARVQLQVLEKGDGPDIGHVVYDRPRAVALLRYMIPAEYVASCTVEGRDWQRND